MQYSFTSYMYCFKYATKYTYIPNNMIYKQSLFIIKFYIW